MTMIIRWFLSFYEKVPLDLSYNGIKSSSWPIHNLGVPRSVYPGMLWDLLELIWALGHSLEAWLNPMILMPIVTTVATVMKSWRLNMVADSIKFRMESGKLGLWMESQISTILKQTRSWPTHISVKRESSKVKASFSCGTSPVRDVMFPCSKPFDPPKGFWRGGWKNPPLFGKRISKSFFLGTGDPGFEQAFCLVWSAIQINSLQHHVWRAVGAHDASMFSWAADGTMWNDVGSWGRWYKVYAYNGRWRWYWMALTTHSVIGCEARNEPRLLCLVVTMATG